MSRILSQDHDRVECFEGFYSHFSIEEKEKCDSQQYKRSQVVLAFENNTFAHTY